MNMYEIQRDISRARGIVGLIYDRMLDNSLCGPGMEYLSDVIETIPMLQDMLKAVEDAIYSISKNDPIFDRDDVADEYTWPAEQQEQKKISSKTLLAMTHRVEHMSYEEVSRIMDAVDVISVALYGKEMSKAGDRVDIARYAWTAGYFAGRAKAKGAGEA
ncbi:MAG: hypothetical protein PUB77_07710 [Clostridiales bacterium]|nr:hypothetical protein [Clostridiales bacterium]